jgi:DNA-binding NtrC family response regulator
MVAAGSFRRDLYYRLDVVRLALPPLRERGDDVLLLAQHFLEKHRRSDSPVLGFAPGALEALAARDWPGNVRELENAIEAALALAGGERLGAAEFTLAGVRSTRPRSSTDLALPLSLDAYERSALERALDECRGDATGAARRLGIGRSTFYRKLVRHGISVPRRGGSAGAASQADAAR